ncbi:hypothetical protein DSO57_1023195 [Entomophthora muscae]|uniref:Uncharacterized protein n=1 Tax=Entomophthora muscae TaxID=34485 RepID=A0ACC2U0R3_9FUNG|nr:hypothetical protein DSO57_1023195 [Entomophthora muscae]
MAQKGVDTGDVKKKSKGQKGEAVVPYTVPLKTTPKAIIPDYWEDHWEGDADASFISGEGSKAGGSAGGATGFLTDEDEVYDNPDWLDKVGANAMAGIEASLTEVQHKQLMMCKQLFTKMLDNYDIDAKCAQEWEDEGVRPQDIIKWCSLGFSMETSKEWLACQFKVDAAMKWHQAGADLRSAFIFCKHQVSYNDASLWMATKLPYNAMAYIVCMCISYAQASPWIMSKYPAEEIVDFVKCGLPGAHAQTIMVLGLPPAEAKAYYKAFPDSSAWEIGKHRCDPGQRKGVGQAWLGSKGVQHVGKDQLHSSGCKSMGIKEFGLHTSSPPL